MEDDLPKKLFSIQYIYKIIDTEDFNLLTSMIPSTLLMESLHNKGLSWKTIIGYLLFGASFVIIFYFMQKHIIENEPSIYKHH